MRIVLLDDYQGVALDCADWDSLGADVRAVDHHIDDHDELAAVLAGAEVVMVMRERTPLPASLIERLPDLRLVVTAAMYNASIDLAAATERGITVCGTRGDKSSTAELTWGLIFALLRDIPGEQQSLRDGGWQRGLGVTLAGRTMGLLGLGTVGAKMARTAAAFGMRVLAWSTNLTADRARECGAELASKEELLRAADIVSVHLVLGERNRNLVGAPELALMRPDAHLVNTSRAAIVDTEALAEALHAGRLAGAAVDVYDVEPVGKDNPLLDAPNTVLTPHIGYVTREEYRRFYGDAVDAIRAWRSGSPIRVINDVSRST
jgi:phosphoglycerate dehydrogenase-like enzyme